MRWAAPAAHRRTRTRSASTRTARRAGAPALPADAELERDERLHVALGHDELAGFRERGDAGGERGDRLEALAERDEPLALDHGLGAGDRAAIDGVGRAEVEARVIEA